MGRLRAAVVLGLISVCAVAVAGAGGMTAKVPAVSVSASNISAHTAKLTAKINPEGSTTTYKIWVDPGCSGGTCERVPPREVKTGQVGGGKGAVKVSATVRELEEGTSNNEAWVEATNTNGTAKSKVRVFKTK